MVRRLRRLVWVAAAASSAWLSRSLAAQGVTTAAIRGVVRAENGADVDGALVRVVNKATGYTKEISVRAGFFVVPALETGGPYTVDVRRIGYAPLQHTGLYLALGERLDLDLPLVGVATRLDSVTVTASRDHAQVATAGGVGTSISDSALRRLPTLNGDMYDFLRMVPQVGTRVGLSGAGATFRLNTYVIDGVSDRQLQGNNASGGPNGTKSISLDAVKEYQVLLSPFDARYGDFTGLLVNAVTKSGTNDFHGSVYGYVRNAKLARSGSFLAASAYDREQYGFSIGGPILRDRMHFFLAPEIQRAAQPARGPYVGQAVDATTPVPAAADSIARFAALLRDRGINAGDGGRVMLPNPNLNIFGRIDVALPELESRLVLRENVSRTEATQFARSETTKGFPLSSNASTTRTKKQTTAMQVFTQLSASVFNEFQASHTDAPLLGVPYTLSPLIQVAVRDATLSAGPGLSAASGASQISTELSDHLVFQPGASHTLGVGAHVEFFRYHVIGYRNRLGQWAFANLDAIARGAASSFVLAKDFGAAESPVVGAEPSAYVSDEWRLNDRLSLTLGLRADGLSFSQQPAYNPDVDATFGRRTSDYPSFRPQWSPRFGFVWTPDADQRTSIHGGAGMFAGRPPLGWLVNPMRSNGAGVKSLTCGNGNAPTFTPYPATQPTTCADGAGFSNGAVALVDRNLRMAQTLRTSLTVERRLPWSATGSIEGLYSKVRSDFAFSNVNLQGPVGVDPHGRVMYGTIDAAGAHAALVPGSTFSEVVDLRNQSGGYSWSVTGQLDKPWSDRLAMHASYTYSRVRDVQSVVNGSVSVPLDAWANQRPLSSRLDDRSTGVSAFEIPHRVVLSATYVAHWRHRTTDISLYYVGESGAPFTYGDSTSGRLNGDLNADGTAADDPIYVPRNATDPSEIMFAGSDSAAQGAAFEQFIRDTPCLQRQRGRILARNSCRGAWVNTSNLSVRQSLPAISGHAATLQLEVFNVLNLLDKSWGLFELPNVWILQYAGQAVGPSAQPKFTFNPATTHSVRNAESGYQLQLSLRYSL